MGEQKTEFQVPETDRSTYTQQPADRGLYKKVKDMVGIREFVYQGMSSIFQEKEIQEEVE